MTEAIWQLIIVFGLLIGAVIIGTILNEYYRYKKILLAAELESDAYKLKVELVQQRGSEVIELLKQWMEKDHVSFKEMTKDGKIFIALDKNYKDIGLSGEIYSAIFSTKEDSIQQNKQIP